MQTSPKPLVIVLDKANDILGTPGIGARDRRRMSNSAAPGDGRID